MSIDQPYAVHFIRHAAWNLDDMFRYITCELDAEKAAKELMREVETSIADLREFSFLHHRRRMICWLGKVTER